MNDYDPVNKITMKNMSNLNIKVIRAQERILDSIPAKYQDLVKLYGELAVCNQKVEDTLDVNHTLAFEDYHLIKELSQSANEAAASTKPLISKELRETAMDVWSMFKSDKNDDVKAVNS